MARSAFSDESHNNEEDTILAHRTTLRRHFRFHKNLEFEVCSSFNYFFENRELNNGITLTFKFSSTIPICNV